MIDISSSAPLFLSLGLPGGWEWAVILVIGLLIFGRRLPEIAKGLGRSIVEFKKGIKGIDTEIEEASTETAPRPPQRLADAPTDLSPRKSRDPSYAAGPSPDDGPSVNPGG
jgi:sec-independent protein translocase protein TatA